MSTSRRSAVVGVIAAAITIPSSANARPLSKSAVEQELVRMGFEAGASIGSYRLSRVIVTEGKEPGEFNINFVARES